MYTQGATFFILYIIPAEKLWDDKKEKILEKERGLKESIRYSVQYDRAKANGWREIFF